MAFYNLDVTISVGYRVNSKHGTQFRIWATQVLRAHILKGYSANQRRLKELRQSLNAVDPDPAVGMCYCAPQIAAIGGIGESRDWEKNAGASFCSILFTHDARSWGSSEMVVLI